MIYRMEIRCGRRGCTSSAIHVPWEPDVFALHKHMLAKRWTLAAGPIPLSPDGTQDLIPICYACACLAYSKWFIDEFLKENDPKKALEQQP